MFAPVSGYSVRMRSAKSKVDKPVSDHYSRTEEQLSQDTVSHVLGATIKEIRSAVARGYRVQLTGFGTFYPSHRKARKGRNLQTGDTIDIPAMTLPRFTPGN